MSRYRSLLAFVILFACVALLLFAQAVAKPLDHDEHQFVASGWLIARAGLWPYRDFPYFHLPYLSVIYALVYLFTDHLLLAARAIAVLAALGCALVLFHVLRGAKPDGRSTFIGAAAILIWLFNPITQYATGLAWNHDTPLLACLLAFAFFVRRPSTRRNAFLSGLCLALAIGIRATFALAVPAFILFAGFGPERRARLAAWSAGLALGALPIAFFFWLAPSQFIFGNVTYAALNTEWRIVNEYDRAMTLSDKFAFLLGDVIGWSSTLFVLAALVPALWMAARRRLAEPFWLAVALSAALGVSAFLPTPTFAQYFYSAIPFVVLSVALACRGVPGTAGVVLMLALLLVSSWHAPSAMRQVPVVFTPEQWTPLLAHQTGAWIRERAGPGSVATLAPLYPLEAGLPIYPALATGPFAYRVGTLMTAAERSAQGIIAQEELGSLLDARPPRALLLGYEPEEQEGTFVDYARARQFKYQRLPNGKNLWLSP